jgi:hypothetical protein
MVAGDRHLAKTRLIVALVAFALLFVSTSPVSGLGPCDAPIANPIVCENSLPGNPSSEWEVWAGGDSSIQGFTTEFSVNKGQQVQFKVKTDAAAYRLDIYRLGYYNSAGARKVSTVSPSVTLPQSQPSCLTDVTSGLIDCGNWAVSATWNMPSTAVSGIYFARAVRLDNSGASHIVFVVRDDAGHSDLLFQTSDTTWQAYNPYGGKSLYDHRSVGGRAYKVSYNRPFITRELDQINWLFRAEYPMVRWLEANGYNVSYTSGIDTERRGAELLEHRAFLSVGHDEYWSGHQRANVEAARDAGVDLAFFSGNDVFYKTRWENSIDGSGTPFRTLVTYKESFAGAKIDPSPVWTGTWRDDRLSPPSDGGRPENGLTGTIFTMNWPRNDAIQIPAAEGRMRFWRNTSVAGLGAGQVATLPTGVLGHEWNEDLDNGARPAGLVRMSSTTVTVQNERVLNPWGTAFGAGTGTHALTLYKAPSGALVFSAGTIQWSWGLDSEHDHDGAAVIPDSRMRQATVNLLADMGAQPGSLQAGLISATASADSTKPTSVISAPANNTNVVVGTAVTISGTATDTGGQVGGVEVSVDNGATWHPATGREAWSYQWTPSAIGSTTIRSRSVDDSGNLQTTTPGVSINVTPKPCPCTLFATDQVPGTQAYPDPTPIEVGVKFRADVDGYATGVRFYKGSGNGGTHMGHLWTDSGVLLGTATFNNETATGWQEATFASPAPISANVTYVVSYFAPQGRFALDGNYFATAKDRAPLHAPGGANGVFKYHPAGGFPADTYASSNYWVDVVFNQNATDTLPPTVIEMTPANQATAVLPALSSVTAVFNEQVTPASIQFVLKNPAGVAVPGTVSYSAPDRKATLLLGAALAESTTYTATVSGAVDSSGNLMPPFSWTFTTSGPATSFWTGSTTPVVPAYAESNPIEVGLKFSTQVNGYIRGVRFYKGLGNNGSHVGNLWSSNGQLLASVTFVNETPTGWQEVLFGVPVQATANTTYVVSYFAPQGHFAVNNNFFNAPLQNYPLSAPSGGNGVFKMSPTSAFPTDSYASSNYWVDVVFGQTFTDQVPPSLVNRSPAAGATGIGYQPDVGATFSEPVNQASISFTLRNPGGVVVPANVTYDAPTKTVTLRPTTQLATNTTYTATLTGATDPSGNTMAPATWSFTTFSCPCSIWPNTTVPETQAYPDGSPIEVGVRFKSDINGFITGMRFFKGPGNSGTHVGNLWSSTGTLLASVTFANENPSGWQVALFSTPVQATANTTYVVSYTAPAGRFALNPGYFTNAPTVRFPLRALQSGSEGSNGVFGPPGAFPTGSYGNSNYWVDAEFALTFSDGSAPTVVERLPLPNATSAGFQPDVTAKYSEPINPATVSFTLRNAGGVVVPSNVTYDAPTLTSKLRPNQPLSQAMTYTVSLSGATDTSGNAMVPVTWSFTTVACPCSIWGPNAMPSIPDYDNGAPLEVGLKFRVDVDGLVTGVRFYKGAGNTGAHTGRLWTASGQPLGTVTFVNETATGWQQALFASPIPVVANTTYVVSYSSPSGHFALTPGQFASAGVVQYPLRALQSGVDGQNAVFKSGAIGAFPTDSYQGANYWVDVIFTRP